MAIGLITTPFKEENVKLPMPETAAPQKPLPQATTDLPSTGLGFRRERLQAQPESVWYPPKEAW